MSEILISRRQGGGISSSYAAIGVSYPAGSVCTCTKGSISLRAEDTSGAYIFGVPEAGTWIVTSTNGTKTKSQNVYISYKYQSVNISIKYDLIIFDNGAIIPMSTAFFAGQVNNSTIGNTIHVGASGSACSASVLTTNPINITEFGTLYATVTAIYTAQYSKGWLIIDSDRNTSPYNYGNAPGGFIALANIPGVQTVSLNVSSLTGSYYVGIGYGAGDGVTVSKLWLV